MRKTMRGLWLIMSTSFKADPPRAIGAFVMRVLESGSNVLLPYWLKLLTDGAIGRDGGKILLAACGYGGGLAFLGLTNMARNRWMAILSEQTAHHIDRQMITMSTRIPSISHHERAEFANEMELLRQQRGMLGNAVYAIFDAFRILIMLGGSIALLGGIHPWLLVLPLFGIPTMIAGVVTTNMHEKAREETVEGTRSARHLFDLTTTAGPAKELRIFGIGPELVRFHRELRDIFDRRSRRMAFKTSAIWMGAWLIFAVGYIGALVFVTIGAVRMPDQITPGDVLMAFAIAGDLGGYLGGVVGTVSWLRSSLKTVGRLLWLIDLDKESRPKRAEREVPVRIDEGIRFDGVSFRYPETETDVLSDVDLFFPAGSTVALVGENGAGKTTLIKLLCRFYEPSSGAISLDGTPFTDLGVDEWRTRIAGGFQDFVKFEFLARQTVGVGDLTKLEDLTAIDSALDRASATDVLPALPSGLDTQLGKSFDDGFELSQGQWQKLALGRAMMRDVPLLLLLDEPTASLDAETEHALFERYASAASSVGRANGAITVLVSHRFSTVRMADLIIVIDGGSVIEHGSHHELMRKAGTYAELFTMQADAYR